MTYAQLVGAGRVIPRANHARVRHLSSQLDSRSDSSFLNLQKVTCSTVSLSLPQISARLK